MEWSVKEELMAQAIGYEVMKQLRQEGWLETLVQGTEARAVQILEEIRQILDNETTSDPECFRRIGEIVNVLETEGIYTVRSDRQTEKSPPL